MTNYLTAAQYRAQKSALTRAVNTGDADKILAAVKKTVNTWNDGNYAWPDDWANWQRALDDSRPWNAPRLDIQSYSFGA